MIADAELAWRLVEAARPCLNRRRSQLIFVELGSGNARGAIEKILWEVYRTGFSLPADVVALVERWLSGYAGCLFEVRLRVFLDEIRTAENLRRPKGSRVAIQGHTVGLVAAHRI